MDKLKAPLNQIAPKYLAQGHLSTTGGAVHKQRQLLPRLQIAGLADLVPAQDIVDIDTKFTGDPVQGVAAAHLVGKLAGGAVVDVATGVGHQFVAGAQGVAGSHIVPTRQLLHGNAD